LPVLFEKNLFDFDIAKEEKVWSRNKEEPYRVSACSDDETRTNAREAFKRQSIAVAMRSTLDIPSVYAYQREKDS